VLTVGGRANRLTVDPRRRETEFWGTRGRFPLAATQCDHFANCAGRPVRDVEPPLPAGRLSAEQPVLVGTFMTGLSRRCSRIGSIVEGRASKSAPNASVRQGRARQLQASALPAVALDTGHSLQAGQEQWHSAGTAPASSVCDLTSVFSPCVVGASSQALWGGISPDSSPSGQGIVTRKKKDKSRSHLGGRRIGRREGWPVLRY